MDIIVEEMGVSDLQSMPKHRLQELVEQAKPCSQYGKVAQYIPALSTANPAELSIAYYSDDGCVSAGDATKSFTMQSISKIIALALAIDDNGFERVFEKVGMEPTGAPFQSMGSLAENASAKPLNPMINAGALAVTNLIKGETNQEKFGRILKLVQKLANNERIAYNQNVARSEFETANLNRSLGYFLKEHQIIDGDIEELLDLYTKQCAIELNGIDLARIGYVLAHRGYDPHRGEVILTEDIARTVITLMVTCGMYNESGEFAVRAGIPAKSGVSGGILSLVPGKMGIGVYGPSLNRKGNSIAGVKLLQLLSEQLQLSIF